MKPASDSATVRAFRRVADRFLEESFVRFPQSASRLGLSAFNGRLGVNDPSSHREQNRLLEQTLAEVESLPEAAFAGDDWLDRRAFLSMVRTELLDSRELARWRVNPQVHCDTAVDALFDLIIRHTGRLGPVMPALEARLASLPDFLAAGLEGIRAPVPLWSNLARRACEGAVGFLQEVEPELAAHSTSPRRLKSLIASAEKAFVAYADGLSRKKPGAVGGFSLGRGRFEFLMRERLGFDLSLPEAAANGRRLVVQMSALLEKEARRLGGGKAREILEKAADSWLPDRPLIDEYRAVTEQIKTRLATLDLVTTPPGETLAVLPAPAFLRHHFPTAAYNAPPPFSRKQQGIFWVNDLSLLQSDPERKRAEIRQHFGLELTSAHEGYPGHHLQFAVQNRHPSRLRRLASHAIFYEGWTMWCEHLAVEKGLVENPHARLQQIHDALWRAHRIVIDCGLHDGSLSHRAASQVLQQGVGFTKARAAGDVNWYTSSPTVPMSYLLGRIEVEKLHRRFVANEGWTLKRFNDWMLSHGALPWSWIVQAHDQVKT